MQSPESVVEAEGEKGAGMMAEERGEEPEGVPTLATDDEESRFARRREPAKG